ncbi:MAG TPA: PKD domain-containing protein [bacterium]|nr:PKD domain-containing protein [bacterium]HPN44651.1 PKD domain-containing protein [bacterium]
MKKNFVLKIPVLLMLIFSSLYAVDYTETRIWANDAAGSDYFGHAVAGDNYRVVVGAWGEDDQGNSTGAVYLYEKDGNLWEQTNRFKPGDGNGYEAFGKAVDIESNTIIVGAPDDIDPTTSGAAYVYEYISGGWEPTKLTPPDGANGDSFGSSVSVSGEYIAIGASKHDLPDFKGAGVVYIYKKGVSSWDHEATISLTGVGAGPYADDNFGSCVSLDGNRIAIGAHKRNGPENTVQDVGAVFIFVREGTTWSLEKRLDPPQAVANAWFGKSVALDGDDIAVGSPTNSATTAGDVYAFSYNGTNWVLDATLVPGDLTGDNWWGSSVALYNNTLVGGQYLDGDHGAVYVYQKSGEVWGAPQKITPVEAQAAGDDKFGYAVALNGADVIVGAEDGFAKEGGASVNLAGAAYIYTAPQTLEPLAADFQASVTSGNLPLTVNFTDLSTGSPTTWKWNFGDSTTSEVQSPSHIYNKPGIFNVTLQISDGTATNSITKTGYISVHVTQPGNNVWTSYSNALMFGQPNQFAVRSMCYDPFTDHLLVGTTGGVAEFSGVYWSSYAVSEDIDHQEVLAVAVDSSGNKWFGLENGVQVYRESDSTFYNPTGGQVNDIFVQSNGSIWLATSTGLATFDGATWTVYTAENSDLPGNNLTRITMDPSHTTFIVSSQDGGIYVFEKGVWQVYDTEDGLTDNTVYDVVLDWNYNAWIAPETGSIVRLNRDDVTTYEPMGDNESERQYTSVGVDSLGNVWASSANAGVARFDGVAWTHYDEEGSDLSSDLVRCKDILVDPNGVVWFGTEDAGVCRFGPTVAPAIDFYADVITGFAPLTVNFFGVAAGGTPTYWLWDFDNDGETDILNDQNPSWTFDVPGYYSVKLFAPMGDENYQEIKTNYIHVLESIQNSASLSGKVTDATTGYPVAGATVTLGDSTKITDSEGNYAFINMPISDLVADFTGLPRSGEAPLTVQFTDLSAQGRLYLTAAKTGYINYSTFVTLPQGNTTMDISLSPTIAEGGMRVVLNWGQTPYDLDIYLKTPEIEGSFYQVYYSNKGSATIAPYANLDVDDRSGYGPETITIHDLFSGVYRCYIHNYSGTPALTQSAGVVQIYNDTGLLETVNVPLSGEGRYWYIGDIDGATGNVTIYNTIQESAPGSSASSPLTLPAKEPLDRIDASPVAVTTWAWDFDNDGDVDATTQNPQYTYTEPGVYSVKLTVSDGEQQDTKTRTEYITVGTGQTFGSLSGKVTNAITGIGIEGAIVTVAGYADTTDEAGNYSFTHIPSGLLNVDFSGDPRSGNTPLTVQFTDLSTSALQLVSASAEGYYSYSQYVMVLYAGSTLNISLSPVLDEGNMRVVLTWNTTPADMDIHLYTPAIGGKTYQVYYSNKGDSDDAPYAVLDIDDRNGTGPETITIYELQEGTYKCYVHNYSGTPGITASSGLVQIFNTSGLVEAINVPTTGEGQYWYVCDINGATGAVTVVNTLQTSMGSSLSSNKLAAKSYLPEEMTDGFAEASETITTWAWDFNNDGTVDATTKNPQYTYTSAGVYDVKLTVSDGTQTRSLVKQEYITVNTEEYFGDLSGKVTNAITGIGIEGAIVTVAGYADTTDEAGNYSFTHIPSGLLNVDFSGDPRSGNTPLTVQFTDLSTSALQLVSASAEGYYSYSQYVMVLYAGSTLNISLSPVLDEGNMRVVLTWNTTPADMDIHLYTPAIGGKTYQVYYSNKGDSDDAPYAVLDIDDRNGTGPETITIYELQEGTYKCYVHNYSGTPGITASSGLVQIFNTSGLVEAINVPTTGEGQYWYVCDINGATGAVTVVNTLQTSMGSSLSSNKLAAKSYLPEEMTDGFAEASETITTWAWDFNNDGTVDATTKNPQYTYTSAGVYDVKLTVSDGTQTRSLVKQEYITVTEEDTVEYGNLSGQVVNAITGVGIEGAIVTIAGYTTTTNSSGYYVFEHIPVGTLTANFAASPVSGYAPLTVYFADYSSAGAQLINVSATGYYGYNRYVSISPAGTVLNISLSPVIENGDMRIVLTWNTTPADMDLHLFTPAIGGKTYQVYYSNKGSENSAPYAELDIDDRNGTGPETITLYDLQEGTYKCYVHNYSGTPGITTSEGLIQIFNTSGLVEAISVPTGGEGQYWYVCDINGTTGAVTVVNTLQSSMNSALAGLQPSLGKNNLLPEKPAYVESVESAQSTSAVVSWQWDFNNDGDIDATTQNPLFIYNEPGVYTVSLTVSDGTNTDKETKYNYITVTENTELEGYIVSINAIDYDNFPTVKLYSSVMNDNTLLPVNGLLSTAFSLAEDGATSTITNITQVTTTDKLPLDITFVVDIEDNMTAHLAKLKAYAPVLTDSLALLGLDCRYGLVTFRDMVASINDLTADAAHFTSMLNDIPLPLASENNSYNNLLEALARAAQFSYRENAMRMVIVLTDTTYYNNDITHTTYTPAVIGNMLLNNGITTLMICTDNDQLKTLGNEANAGRFDITEDLTGTLRKLVKIMGSQYIITYTSPHPTPTDYWRYVLLTVNANDMGGYDAAQYKVGSTRIVLGSGTIPGIVNTYFTLDIYAQSVINLKQCLIDVGYDATALEYVSGTIGSFLGTDITDLTAPGTNKVIINLNRTATTGVSGTGVLYSLRFKILKATSTSPFTFNQVTLQDPSGTNITYTTETPELESPYVDDGTGNLVSRLRGDFNNDSYISLVDLAMLSTYWGIADSIKGDIGPAYGDLPFLTTLNDNLVNEQDLFIFALMWNWYHQNLSYISGGLSKSNSVITWLPSADNQTSKTVEVNLQISEVRNMNMGHVQFSYDPAVLQFKTVQAGEFWIKDKASVALFVDNDDKAGVVNIAFARLADREMNAEAAGSGALFTAEFERINLTAASILELRNLDLRNSANKTMLKTSGASISIDGMTLPKAFALSQNYPNPFNSTTTLQFSMPKEENVTIEVFNILGQPVRTLIDTRFEPGVHKVMWNGKNDQDMDVVSGIYFVRMKSASFKQVKQILLLK